YKSGSGLDSDKLRGHLVGSLPSYMIPGYLIEVSQFPLTANGKVARDKLPSPEENIRDSDAYMAPRTHVEGELVRIWQEVLGHERIGINDNFFELGGNSFKIIKLHKKINDLHPNILKITDMFLYYTINVQALMINKKTGNFKGDSELEELSF
ncbi:MAG: phosphopantetheine-binding protein, partial [Cytophagales bacterium]|nr:phosphopantetheine-binding protein [Cytophagales bacterium]